MSFNFNDAFEQAKKLKNDFEKKRQEFAKKEFTASSGGKMVTVTINGAGKVISLDISEEAYKEQKSILTDLIIAAFNKAKEDVEKEAGNSMSYLGDLGLQNIFGDNSSS